MVEKTEHEIIVGDSRYEEVDNIDLVVTSPPYPMVEMWDGVFSSMNEEIKNDLESGNGYEAHEKMHDELDKVWSNIAEGMNEGGIVCINIGDATRRLGGEFKLYPNRDRVVEFFLDNGFNMLPGNIWRKISTGSSKFKGSGMLPTNAYFAHDHEHILVFRKGDCRSFEPKSEKRYESTYFWSERNQWFSDLWDVTGTRQDSGMESRDRLAAFPLEIPYRLISMFSIYGDTVLDPFCGTGTTLEASLLLGRNSVNIDKNEEVTELVENRLDEVEKRSVDIIEDRIEYNNKIMEDKGANYEADNYDTGVKSTEEKSIKFYKVDKVEREDNTIIAEYEPY